MPGTATRPPGFDARDPADPRYDFARADAAIVAAAQRGLTILASFSRGPAWADGNGRPAAVTPGTWKPSATALEEYGAALARRYSGTFPDPARPGRTLPGSRPSRSGTNPTSKTYLAPQWTAARAPRRRSIARCSTASTAASVRRLEGARRHRGTGPFGDPEAGGRGYSRPASGASCCVCGRSGDGCGQPPAPIRRASMCSPIIPTRWPAAAQGAQCRRRVDSGHRQAQQAPARGGALRPGAPRGAHAALGDGDLL